VYNDTMHMHLCSVHIMHSFVCKYICIHT